MMRMGDMFKTLLKVTLLKVCVLTGTYHITYVEAAAPNIYKEHLTRHCPRNEFVSVYENGTKRCTKCKRCPKGFEVKMPCDAFTDTICEPCSSGWYNDVSGGKCEPCSGCEVGTYIRRSCENTRNTKCRKCPRRMFSAYSNMTTCLPCKNCKQNEKQVSTCSRSRDTVCGECFHDHFRISSTGSCLPCSPCPTQLRDKVVPECRKKLGIDSPTICWPNTEGFRVLSSDDRDFEIDKITDSILWTDSEEQQNIQMKFAFITALLCSFLGCILFIFIAFLCFRSGTLTKCTLFQNYGVLNGINDRVSSRAGRETNNTLRDDDHQFREKERNNTLRDNAHQFREKERNSFCSRKSDSDCTSLITTDSQTFDVNDTSNFYDTCCPSPQHSWTSDCTRAIG